MKTFIAFLLACCAVSLVQAEEDLTTLDGKTYTNITEVAKSPSRVFFSCNGERIGVAITNLPDQFLAGHGIPQLQTSPRQQINVQAADLSQQNVSVAIKPFFRSTNPVDLFLVQNRDSDLYVERVKEETIEKERNYIRSGRWTIHLTPVQINLKAENHLFSEPTNYYKYPDQEMSLTLGQEDSIEPIFDKFFEWESIAKTNKAEPFDKIIARWPGSIYTTDGMRHFTFYWNTSASLGDSDGSGLFSSVDVSHLRQLLKLVPELKEELAQKIRNKEAQKDLFK